MCQYSAINGVMTDWHTQHLMQLGYSAAGLIMVEATAVEKIGRITHNCVGIYNNKCIFSLKKNLQLAKSVASNKSYFGIQLAHAGRKASTQRPWEGRSALTKKEKPWKTICPSPIPFQKTWHVPQEMKLSDIERVKKQFISASLKAVEIGFDLIEIHGTHGYLLHQFLSSISNKRKDKYGGNLENRMRFGLEVVKNVREVWSSEKPLFFRISSVDGAENGSSFEENIIFLKCRKKKLRKQQAFWPCDKKY